MSDSEPGKKRQRGKRGGARVRARREAEQLAAFQDRLQETTRSGSFGDFEKLISQSVAGGFEGAGGSTRRGAVIWPTLDTRKELDRYGRRELMKKARWLRANMGLANRIVRGLADLVGYLTPVAMTGDEAWDEAAEELWADRAEEAAVLDASGKFGARQLQIEANAAAFGDGDCLLAILRGSNPATGLRVALYEAHQIDQPWTLEPVEEWFDGVRVNKFGRHKQYHLVDFSRYGMKLDGSFIAARDAIYYAHFDAPGRVRPPSILARAVNHLVDIAEIAADWKTSIKVSSLFGVYIKNQLGAGAPMGPRSLVSDLRDETVEGGAEGGDERTVKMEDIITQGGLLANLPEGSDVQTIADSRPHPNQMALLAFLIRDVAWGAGVSPEIIWDLSTLRGANNRLANADLQRWIGQKQLRQKSMMKRMWTTFVAKEMEAGRLGEPRGGAPWWKHSFIPQASITADKGRDGKLNMDLVGAGLRSLATQFGEEGLSWERELRQIAKERRAMRELGIEEETGKLKAET